MSALTCICHCLCGNRGANGPNTFCGPCFRCDRPDHMTVGHTCPVAIEAECGHEKVRVGDSKNGYRFICKVDCHLFASGGGPKA